MCFPRAQDHVFRLHAEQFPFLTHDVRCGTQPWPQDSERLEVRLSWDIQETAGLSYSW